MQDDTRVVALALTTLSLNHEGVFLVGRTGACLPVPGSQLRLNQVAHLLIRGTEEQEIRNVFIEPVVGFEEVWVNTTSYTAYGYLTGELLEKYLAWEAAQNTEFPAVEEPDLPTG